MTAPPSSPLEPDPPHALGRRVLINTGALSGSSLWRIGTSFVLQLLIARILGVQSLGVYTVALAYLNVGQVISELGLPALLARDLAPLPRQRLAFFRRAVVVQTVASVLVWLGLVLLAYLLPYEPAARSALVVVGASLPFYAVTSACETLFRAAERMELVMAVEVFVNVLILVLSAIVLLMGSKVPALIGILVITQAVSALACLLIVRRQRLVAAPQEPAGASWRELWQQTSPFFGLSIAEVLQQRLDILLLSVIAGPAVTGIYSAAYNLVRMLVKLTQSFWQALYPTFSRLHHEASPSYQTLSDLSLRFGLLVLLPCAALVTGVAEELIHLVYGPGYAASAPVLRALIWIAPVLFLESYAVIQLMVHRRTSHALAIIGLYLVTLLVALPALASVHGATGAAWASLTAASAACAAGLLALRRNNIRFRVDRFAWLAVSTLATTLLASLLPLHWLVRFVLAGAAYVSLVWLFGLVSPTDMGRFRRVVYPDTQ